MLRPGLVKTVLRESLWPVCLGVLAIAVLLLARAVGVAGEAAHSARESAAKHSLPWPRSAHHKQPQIIPGRCAFGVTCPPGGGEPARR